MDYSTCEEAQWPGTAVARAALGIFAVFLEVCVHSTLWMSFSLASLVPFVQLHCAGAAGAASFAALAAGSLDWRPFWTGAAESVAVYTLDHLRDLRKALDKKGAKGLSSTSGLKRHRRPILQALFGASLAGFFGSLAAARSGRVVATFVGHVALCACYAKLKPKMPYLKAAYVSLCVVFMALAAPAAYAPGLLGVLGTAALARLCLLVFCVAFTVEHLQDLRDVDEDQEMGVVTLPSGLGAKRAGHILRAVQAGGLLLHVSIGAGAGLPWRVDMLAVHVVCCLCSLAFGPQTPRCLFQVALEPLYAAPLAATALRLACRGAVP